SFVVHSGSSWTAEWLGMAPSGGNDDFAVGSPGRNGAWETFNFGTSGPDFYINEEMADYGNDLVSWNGQFVKRPSSTSSGT
ncbi:MAG: hypothetical protein V3R45_01425, partial [Candidatus Aminicenantaceae bacterium]